MTTRRLRIEDARLGAYVPRFRLHGGTLVRDQVPRVGARLRQGSGIADEHGPYTYGIGPREESNRVADWQVAATTIHCDAVDDDVTIIVHRDCTTRCTG
jgi:hypothetical protein